MASFTATANSSTTIGYALYGSSSWNTGSTNGACQGAYSGSSSSSSRVGVMVFNNAGATLKGASISQIQLQITCSAAGSSGSSKVLTFRRANYQSLVTSVTGSAQVGTMLGTLTGKFYDNTVVHTLNATTNASFFSMLAAYLAEGNSVLVLYNGETSSSYSTNYARVTSCTILVTYTVATVWYCDNGTWKPCAVWYCNGGVWVQCAVWYCNGGTWVQI